ncbi:hypothetical protein FN846DRAFT_85414 [Sphaerosporella brunnea]|uniref:F-box domain-containing protein n=1 Tax=Sphaerosporella brunnea TaxID=1250544 RepID=A0A5J5ESH8_9PEZI|nr:hypothetical protein FN846DRAFT_85414 [Sphaerosporella brunnea]
MGEFEAYCHLCGGPLYNPHTYLTDGSSKSYGITSEEATTGERRIYPREAAWLNSARVIGFLDKEICTLDKPRSFWLETGINRAFVSTLGTGGVGSYVEVTGLEHGLVLYVGRVAVHDSCYILLKEALLHVKVLWGVEGDINLDVIAACMVSLSDDVYGLALYTTLDVGGVEEFRGLHGWDGNCTSEAWYLTDFLRPCEGVTEYVAHPPRVGAAEQQALLETRKWSWRDVRRFGWSPMDFGRAYKLQRQHERRIRGHRPPIELLPTELLVQILCHLPKQDVVNLRVASRVTAHIALPQEFWKARFPLDAPYLWELHLEMESLEQRRPSPDWRQMYQDLIISTPKTAPFRGLRNRKRVWKTVMEVAEESWMGEIFEREEPGCYLKNAAGYHCGPDAPSWIEVS